MGCENILELVAPPPEQPPPVRLFRNEERLRRIAEQERHVRCEHRSLGVPLQPPPQPQRFLRKGQRALRPLFFQGEEPFCGLRLCREEARRPPVPPHLVHSPEEGGGRNLRLENKRRVADWAPWRHVQRLVDAPRGHSTPVHDPTCLLDPTKGFGSVPACVRRWQSAVELREHAAHAQEAAAQQMRAQRRSDEELRMREELQAAQHRWDELNRDFLLLPVIMDTLSGRIRRRAMENELTTLEQRLQHLTTQLRRQAFNTQN